MDCCKVISCLSLSDTGNNWTLGNNSETFKRETKPAYFILASEYFACANEIWANSQSAFT